MKVGTAAPAGIEKSRLTEGFERVEIDVVSLTLTIRTAGTNIVNATLIPVKAESVEIFFYLAGIFVARPLRVEVFNAQYPSSACFFGRKP